MNYKDATIFACIAAIGIGGALAQAPQNPLSMAVADARYLALAGGTMTGAIQAPSGALTTPSYAFSADTQTGTYLRTTNVFGIQTGGIARCEFSGALLRCSSTTAVSWSSGLASAAADTGVSRVGAGVVGCGTGANASVAGQCYGATLRTGQTTVSGLPAAATAGAGARAYVTDATVCTFLTTVTGSGSTACPVVSNGTNWVGG